MVVYTVDVSRACRCRLVLGNHSFLFGPAFMMDFIETNPPRRGGPPCPPVLINTQLMCGSWSQLSWLACSTCIAS